MGYADDFWSHCIKTADNCLIWQGTWMGKRNLRYGQIKVKGKSMGAHRYSWMLSHGIIPIGLHVLHHCDNSLCVNPDHLWLGTNLDNISDCVSKGRNRSGRGSQHGKAKLSESIVVKMRELYATGRYSHSKMARLFGISKSQSIRTVNKIYWKHV